MVSSDLTMEDRCSLAAWRLQSVYMERSGRSKEGFWKSSPGIWYFGIACLVAIVSVWLGQYEFGAYDGSMLVDSGWRMYLGQHAYRQFPTLLPPLFLITAGVAMRLFGDHWYAFTLGEAIFYLLLVLVGWALVVFALTGKQHRFRPSLLAAYLAAISIPHFVTLHLWHSVDTSMLATCLLLCYTVRSMQAEMQQHSVENAGKVEQNKYLAPFHLFDWIAIAVSGALWIGKPNIVAAGLGSTLFFAACQQRRVEALLFWLRTTTGGALLALCLLLTVRMNPLSVAHSYLKISGRPAPADLLRLFFTTSAPASTHIDAGLMYAFLLLVAPLLAYNLILRRQDPLFRTGLPLVLAGVLVTMTGLLTNWDIRANDIAPLFFAAAFTTLNVYEVRIEKHKVVRTLLLGLLTECFLLGAFEGIHRTRMISAGAWAGVPSGDLQTRHDRFFGRFTAREDFWKVCDIIDSDRVRNPSGRIFFGQRLEFEYARLGIPSPLQMPVWWHAGSSYPVAYEKEIVQKWTADEFDTVYLADAFRMPQGILDRLAGYDLVSPPGSVVSIYRRKQH